MNRIIIIIAAIAMMALSACSGTAGTDMLADNTAQKDASSLTLTLVWNANAPLYNFEFADYNATLGELYKGNDFETDMDKMEEAIALQLGLVRSNVQGTSTMGFVHFDDETVD